MAIEVTLTQGKTTLIDNEDAKLAERKWHNSEDYAARSVRVAGRNRVIQMHRVIMERILGRPLLTGEEVDHINGDPFDNRRSNLRLADDRQQTTNSKKRTRNNKGDQPSSKYKGVSWSCEKGKWKAQKWFNGQCVYSEYFDDEIEAAFAYDSASIEYDGDFARLNFPWGIVPATTVQLPLQVKPDKKLLHKRKQKTSRFYGVCWSRRDKKWIAGIRIDQHLIYLGNFDDEVVAARNVDRGAIKYLGVDAAKPRLNFPIEDYTATSPIGRTVKDVLSFS
jgi:hypothetical protein